MRRAVALACLLAIAAAGCGSNVPARPKPSSPVAGSPAPSSSTSSSVSPTAVPTIGLKVRLEKVGNFDEPISLAVRRGDPELYVAQKSGEVIAFRPGTRAAPRTVLDISSSVTDSGESGLLGIVFSPDGQWLYASFDDSADDSEVFAFRFSGGRAQLPGRRILRVDQPNFTNHKGGDIAFGPDGDLYLGLGDGGSEGDPNNYGQDLRTLLSKFVRIRPTPDGMHPYAIPPTNPFVGRPGIRPEIWASGFRNPWRWSFDRATGDLWIGDVGQSMWEEIDVQPAGSRAGQNYGWSCFEGSHPYKSCRPPNTVAPIYQYSHDGGACAVVGGDVYRGSAVRGLVGAYVFGDYCLGGLTGLYRDGSNVSVWSLGATVHGLDAFGQDANGELYALSLDGGVYRLTP
jgi:glucose/arabinose dehydrogenase